jgi:GDSL-like Lipase/Acylhydrolase family
VKFDPNAVSLNSLEGSAFRNKSVRLEKLNGFSRGKNLFNKLTVSPGQSLNGDTGIPFSNADYYTSDFILVEPNTQYTIGPNNAFTKVCHYNSLQGFISVESDGATTFTTPANAQYVRISNYNASLNSMQMEVGSVATTYEPYKEDLPTLKIDERIDAKVQSRKPLLGFNDAWVAWRNGEKFPVAFYGDSTFDGMGTTGFSGNAIGIDGNGKSPNSFPVKLQSLLRSITGNNTLRIYNAGFSGMKADWGLSNIVAEFSGSAGYSDAKMVGIGFGINDRLSYQTDKAYREGFKTQIKAMIDWFYNRGIQPFMVTSQSITAPGVEVQYKNTFPLRTAMNIETVANEVKRDVAKEYNLEIVDLNKFTEEFLLYSAYPAKVIAPDRTHFGDVGHNYEAGVLFSHITPITYFASGYSKIDYSCQQLMVGIPEELMTVPDAPVDTFKVFANYTKADSLDTKIMDVYVFNSGRKSLILKAFKSNADSLTYVKINGISSTLDGLQSTLSQLDLGLYRIEVFTGLSNKVDFKGFVIE